MFHTYSFPGIGYGNTYAFPLWKCISMGETHERVHISKEAHHPRVSPCWGSKHVAGNTSQAHFGPCDWKHIWGPPNHEIQYMKIQAYPIVSQTSQDSNKKELEVLQRPFCAVKFEAAAMLANKSASFEVEDCPWRDKHRFQFKKTGIFCSLCSLFNLCFFWHYIFYLPSQLTIAIIPPYLWI